VGAKKESRYSSYLFLTALDEVSGQCHAPAALSPQERAPSTHWVGGWVGLRAVLDTEVRGRILCLCWGSNPGHPECNQTLTGYPSSGSNYYTNNVWSFNNCNNNFTQHLKTGNRNTSSQTISTQFISSFKRQVAILLTAYFLPVKSCIACEISGSHASK
jgi:hypothetical protein